MLRGESRPSQTAKRHCPVICPGYVLWVAAKRSYSKDQWEETVVLCQASTGPHFGAVLIDVSSFSKPGYDRQAQNRCCRLSLAITTMSGIPFVRDRTEVPCINLDYGRGDSCVLGKT